ncbi:MAG: hypothetical protein AAGG48_26700 [Planctomycetota bacterium]
MATLEIPIRIQEDVYTRQEQFRDLGPDIEIGNQGTVRFQTYSFQDGQAIYVRNNGLVVRRNAGFRQPLVLEKDNAESRVYYFRGNQWFQETTTPEASLNSLQQRVGQLGFWHGTYEWMSDVGDVIARATCFLLMPILTVPALLLKGVQFLANVVFAVFICFLVWRIIFDCLVFVLFG